MSITLPEKVVNELGDPKTIRLFVVVKDQCYPMRLPFEAWKVLYDYQQKTNTGFNEIIREALVEYFKKRRRKYGNKKK